MTNMANEQANIVLGLPPELRRGVYANFAAVWHTETEFTLDFACTAGPPEQNQDGVQQFPYDVVARIRIPPAVIFKIAKAIAENVDQYEKTHGTIAPGGAS